MKIHSMRLCRIVACVSLVMLAGCGAAVPTRSAGSTDDATPLLSSSAQSSTGSATETAAEVPTGTDSRAPNTAGDIWIAGDSALAISRDGGDTWQESPLPGASDLMAVAVLPSETITVTGAGSRTISLSTMPVGESTWRTSSIDLPDALSRADIVHEAGRSVGVMVTYQSGAQFSRGGWIDSVDGGASWQQHDAPAGGTVTAVGDTLWLVGGPINTDLYRSDDHGETWQKVELSDAVSLTALGPVVADDASGAVALAAVAASPDATAVHLLRLGNVDAAGAPRRELGPVLPVSGSFGPGSVPANSVAADVMWIVNGSQSVIRVSLATDEAQTISASGLPRGVNSVDLHAENATTAWLRYSATACAEAKTDCAASTGFLSTIDGGANWRPLRNPLGK